ncbi:sulfotransferase family protein [Rhizobium glycinendophyticum]|nr:sulfotransferase family protein [Rhizobium glycinendophyticum]
MADMRGMCGIERGFFFNRIPKSANSTVSVFVAGSSGISSVPGDLVGNWAKYAFPKPSDLETEQLEKFEASFKFTFVRNPYTRVLSAYLDKVKTGKKMPPLPDFYSFCQYLDRGGLHANAHWAPQSSLLLIPLHRFDFIGRMETLSQDMSVVGRRLGFRAVDGNVRAGPKSTNADKLLAEHLDDGSRLILNRLYAEDFDAFGYTKL